MSFVDEIDIHTIVEGLMKRFMKEIKGIDVVTPFPRLTYKDAMEGYGSDKPDLRFDLKFADFSNIVKDSGFKVFTENVKKGGVVVGFVVPGGASYTRNQMDHLVDFTKSLGVGGLAYIKLTDKGRSFTSCGPEEVFPPPIKISTKLTADFKNGTAVKPAFKKAFVFKK